MQVALCVEAGARARPGGEGQTSGAASRHGPEHRQAGWQSPLCPARRPTCRQSDNASNILEGSRELAARPVKLTAEQKMAIDHDGHVMLSARPGSGKTRVIISKLLCAVEALRGTPRAAACITYTNAAVQEIETRLRRHLQVGDEAHFEVSTIHAFCLQYIFRPFCFRLKGYRKGFQLLTQDSEAFAGFVEAACRDSGRVNLRQTDYDEFAQIQLNEAGQPIGAVITAGGFSTKEAKHFWQVIRQQGYVDFALIVYYSLLCCVSFRRSAIVWRRGSLSSSLTNFRIRPTSRSRFFPSSRSARGRASFWSATLTNRSSVLRARVLTWLIPSPTASGPELISPCPVTSDAAPR
jgi:hypothetical protein